MHIPATYTILSRTDTSEYLSRFLFFLPDPPTWSKDIQEAFCFRSHSDAESNAKMILDRLDDPLNRQLGLKLAGVKVVGRKIEAGESYPLSVCRVA